jgi:DNA-binding helix-hairpin-helix protein with protein kinase domain
MSELKTGQIIGLTNGDTITIINELGSGAQGIVYQVDYKSSPFALKWYKTEPTQAFYDNLNNNIKMGAPTKSFLWPLMLTLQTEGSFGYVMKIRPPQYKDFTDFLLAKVKFNSIAAMINAALNIVLGFEKLHIKGFSFQDINDGGFFINPDNGDVLICDNDNVAATGFYSGIDGKSRYMAPEVVIGRKKPDTYTDRYSMALILFLLFYGNHPLEGKRVIACPCLTEEKERELYGDKALFIYDDNNNDNMPVKGIHRNVISRWPLFPKRLQNIFNEAFSQKNLHTAIEPRILESKWKSIICSLRDILIICPHCGKETFIESGTVDMCLECGRQVIVKYLIDIVDYGKILLSPQKVVYVGPQDKPIAIIRTNKTDPSVWALQNISDKEWVVETPSGKLKSVKPQEVMPTKPGLKITFMSGLKGKLN